ncbi:tape measure protein [Capnocytophaga sputigena]|uniref:tape measure protein n=1 Tax=Capnocytophaga sputigena TaxID=1019 RepID=UPI003C71FAB3
MQPQDGALLFQVRADQSQIQKDVEAIKKQFEQMTNKAVEEGKKQANVWQTLLKGATAYFTLQGAQSFISQMVAVRSQFQQLEISFGTMLKSKEKANELMAQMTELAAKTPFGLEEVSEGAKKLLAFQVPAEEVTETLRRMGDVASGLGVPMGQLIHVYGQVKAQGKLMTNDLYQFMNAGIPIIAELSKVVGKSETEIKDMVSAGKIGFTEIQSVIKNMTNEGGLFYNLMAEQSKSLGGQISNLRDNFDQMLNEIGKSSEGLVSGAIKGVSFLVENYETIGKLIAGLIVSYGTYRAALIATAAVQQVVAARTAGMTVAEMAHYTWLVLVEKAQKLLNLTMLANPYALAAAALVGLAVALWSLKDSTDANAEATERHNQLRKEQANLIDDEKNRISGLISTIQDETKSWDERNKAFLALKSSTGSVLDKYTSLNQVLREMSQVLKDLNGRYETMNENMSRDAIGKTQEAIKAKESQIEKLVKMQASDSRIAMSTQREIDRLKREVERDKLVLQKQQNVVVGIDVSQFANSLNGKSKAELDRIRKQINDAYNIKKSPSVGSNFKITDDIQNPFLKYDFNELGRFNQAYKEHIKMIEQAKTQTTDFVAKKNEILALQKQINEAEARNKKGTNISTEELNELDEKRAKLKTLLEEYKKGTGDDLSAKSNTKRITAKNTLPEFDTEKAQRDHNRQIQDDLFAREEARIKIMQDGADKRLAIIQLEYDKQEEEIRRRSEDQLAAFIETEKQKAEAQGKRKKGQDFDTNTEAINAEKARLAENEKVLLASNAEYQRMQQEQVYKDLLEKYQTYTDQRKAIEEKYNADIAALQAKLGSDAPQVKKAQDEKARELKKLDILYKKEGTAIAKLFDNLRKKTVKEIRQTITEAEAEIDELASNLDMGDKDNVEYIQSLRQQIEQTRDTADKSDTVFGKLGTNIKNLFKAKPNAAEWQEAFNGMLSSAQSITGQFSQLGDEFERLGQSTGNDSLKLIGTTINEVANVIDKAIAGAQMGGGASKNAWGAIIGAVIGIGTAMFGAAQRANERHQQSLSRITQEKINQQITYNQLLFQEQMLMKKNTSVFGVKEIANALEYLEAYRQQIKKTSDSIKQEYTMMNGKILPYYNGNDRTKLRNINVKTGHEKTGLFGWGKGKDNYTPILNLYPELIKSSGEFNAELAESILKEREFRDEGRQTLQELVNAHKNAQEAMKKFEEYMKNTFGELGVSIVDSVYNSLQKGEDAFESFAKTVGNVIGKLGKQLVYEIFVADYFKDLQNKIKKAAEDNKDNSQGFTKQTSQIVGEFGNTMKGKIGEMQQFLKDWNNMSSSMGFDFLNEKRQAVEKGFARMSQDSADELNGQFRLQTQLSAEIKNAALQTANFIREMHQSMQNNAAQQLRHLAGIEANTYKLNKMETDLAGMKSILSNIETKGIKMRT